MFFKGWDVITTRSVDPTAAKKNIVTRACLHLILCIALFTKLEVVFVQNVFHCEKSIMTNTEAKSKIAKAASPLFFSAVNWEVLQMTSLGKAKFLLKSLTHRREMQKLSQHLQSQRLEDGERVQSLEKKSLKPVKSWKNLPPASPARRRTKRRMSMTRCSLTCWMTPMMTMMMQKEIMPMNKVEKRRKKEGRSLRARVRRRERTDSSLFLVWFLVSISLFQGLVASLCHADCCRMTKSPRKRASRMRGSASVMEKQVKSPWTRRWSGVSTRQLVLKMLGTGDPSARPTSMQLGNLRLGFVVYDSSCCLQFYIFWFYFFSVMGSSPIFIW